MTLWGGVCGDNIKSKTKKNLPFCFHILTDALSPNMLERIKALRFALNAIYPCDFRIYEFRDNEFRGLPKLNDNYLTYFRLKMASILPQNIRLCLYLDIDMLCLCDIREIFSIDLEDKICAVVRDCYYHNSKNLPNRDISKPSFQINTKSYFNAGFMLIDLEKWRDFEVEKKCFDFLANYIPVFHDQDTLNAVLSKHIKVLGLEYNFMVGHLETNFITKNNFKGGDTLHQIAYSYDEFLSAREQIKILHYLTSNKPWKSNQDSLWAINPPYRYKWWSIAHKTPIFGDELRDEYIKINEENLYAITKQIANASRITRRIEKVAKPFIPMIKKLSKWQRF